MARPCACPSGAQRLREQLGGLLPGELLLPGDQISVTDGEPPPQTGLNVVRAQPLELVLDPPRHDVLVPGEDLHLPGSVVGVVLLDVGEPGDGLALCKVL